MPGCTKTENCEAECHVSQRNYGSGSCPGYRAVTAKKPHPDEKKKIQKAARGRPLTALSTDMQTGLRGRTVNPLSSGAAGSNPALSTIKCSSLPGLLYLFSGHITAWRRRRRGTNSASAAAERCVPDTLKLFFENRCYKRAWGSATPSLLLME